MTVIGPHHPHCMGQPVTGLGAGCCCKGVMVRAYDTAVITDVIYSGVHENTRWVSSRPVLTLAYVSHYKQNYIRIGG